MNRMYTHTRSYVQVRVRLCVRIDKLLSGVHRSRLQVFGILLLGSLSCVCCCILLWGIWTLIEVFVVATQAERGISAEAVTYHQTGRGTMFVGQNLVTSS